MIVKLLTERHLEFLSIKGGCRGPSESTLVKMSNCWKSRALAQFYFNFNMFTAVRFSINYIATINCNIGPCPLQSNADVAKKNIQNLT